MTVRRDGGRGAAARGLDDDEWVIPPQLAPFAPSLDALRRAQGDDFARQVADGLESMGADLERDLRGSDDSHVPDGPDPPIGVDDGVAEVSPDPSSLASELDGVADAGTVRALAELTLGRPDDPAPVSCEVGEGAEKLAAARTRADGDADGYRQWAQRMDSAIRAVEESRDEKRSADRLEVLSAGIDQAADVYEGSEGKTDGETVREELSKALDAARRVMAMGEPTGEQIDEALSALDKARDDVTRNMEAKRKADEEAGAETESQSQSGSRSWSPSQSYQTPNAGGSSSGSSDGGVVFRFLRR